jgi:ABC-type bacteriocin/lantibiotic exporter with double-glycine peptidase domain
MIAGRKTRAIAMATALLVGALGRGATATAQEAAAGEDFVCGPRCVQYVLDWHKVPSPDLVELVREMQWPELQDGSALAGIQTALRERGLHARAVRLPPAARLTWNQPVIVHQTTDGIGHFVVWLPQPAGDKTVIWDGLHGERAIEWKELVRETSDVVLLTSNAAIPENAEYAVSSGRPYLWTSVGVVLALYVGRRLLRGRKAMRSLVHPS